MTGEYDYLMGLLESGDTGLLDEAASIVDGFPDGCDDFVRRRWIRNAIDCGSLAGVQWVLAQGVDLAFRDDEGYTPLLCAIDRDAADRYTVMRLLIQYGAPIDKRGINDWTPLHMAAAREDIEALTLLRDAGADPRVRTRIDSYTTPLEEARLLGRKRSVAFLESLESSGSTEK